ncbi:hypothetical protein AB0M02_29840 [Actinoplanes sp. NPDC051861]|uniref:hypothetical protein n=1 Tax=Actinoplanes sp. NPDC051861 TaxID=3155170 RepID=UPI0034427E84
MLVVFAHSNTGSTVATVHRSDGVVLQLPGFDRKYRVPHDLAHFATERSLGMAGGVFGSIAGGGVFSNMRVLSGKQRHDAAARSKRLLDANKRTLTMAEVLAGVVHRVVEDDEAAKAPVLCRNAWGVIDPGEFPWADEQIAQAIRDLVEMSVDWEATGTVRVTWPESLVAPMPAPQGVKRGRRGRS